MQNHVRAAMLAAPFLLPAATAQAHMTLETAQAAPGSACKAVLRVGHGCEGSATTTFRAQIPEGANRGVDVPKAGEDAAKSKEPARKIVLVQSASAAPQAIKIGALVVTQPWARATPGGAEVAAGYLRIDNTGTEADKLIGGATDIAAAVEFHDMKTVDGVMQMRELTGGLEIPAGGSVEFKPGSLHVMFTHLATPLKQGAPFKATLVFEKAGTIALEFAVEAIGAKGPAEADHSAHKH